MVLISNRSTNSSAACISKGFIGKKFISTSTASASATEISFLVKDFATTSDEEKSTLSKLSASALSKFLKEEEKYGSLF